MSTWFYYDNNGQKQGPITGGQLKGLAKAGQITPETIVETEAGQQCKASRISGLQFFTAPPTPSSVPSKTNADTYEYKCVAAPVALKIQLKNLQQRHQEEADAISSFADTINQHCVNGWEFYRTDSMTVSIDPGCLGGLLLLPVVGDFIAGWLGLDKVHTVYNMLIFRRIR
jgi:hypothetical protein